MGDGHRVIGCREMRWVELYFHQNTYTPKGDKLISIRGRIAVVI
jgi:hypothetical protein